jgi:phosphoglycolate phosphatase
MQKLFLFDFDGVLVDSLDFYVRAVGACLEAVGTPIVQSREDYLALFEGNFYEAMAARGVDLAAFAQAAHEILPRFDYDTLAPFPGMAPVLAALHRDHLLAVISSNGSQTIRAMLARFGYEACFRDVFGSDFLFSKVDKIAHALEQFGASADRTFYIGDTVGDILEARKAGVKTVAVAWGWHSREKLADARPDYLLERPEELLLL